MKAMLQTMSSYSTHQVSNQLLDEIKKALENVSFGSVEIYIQDNVVTQISVRNIKKTSVHVNTINTERKHEKTNRNNN